jgi:probable rRNA maturation factor
VKLHIDIQNACTELTPQASELRTWIGAALDGRRDAAEVSVRLVSEREMTQLNRRYRGRKGSTNVLSFPAELPGGIDHPLLGDIVICPAVVNREAQSQHKSLNQHWMHMLVHGCLHLLGYDHIDEVEARQMEDLETEILRTHGFPCPYDEVYRAEAGA